MATVIDALVVELGLDPSKFTKGLKEALEAAAKGKDALGKGGKEIETTTSHMIEAFGKLRNNVLGLAALFTGGLGLKEFIQSTAQTNVGIGRLNQITGLSTQTIGAWRAAGLLAGGSAESFTGILKTLSLEMAKFQFTGQSELIPLFRSLGLDILDATNNFKDFHTILMDITKAVESKHLSGAQGSFLLSQIGADDAAISAMLKGTAAMRHFFEEGQRLAGQTKQDVEDANKLTEAWNKLWLASEKVGRSIARRIDLTRIMNEVSETLLTGKTPGAAGIHPFGGDAFANSFLGRLFGAKPSSDKSSSSAAPAVAPGISAISDINETLFRAAVEGYIVEAAKKRGIDPQVALQVARSEGLSSYVGDRGSSFGPYQLHYGNVASGGMSVSGLGDEFTKKTGLDARDKSTVKAQIDFALDQAKAGGWSPWHGWRGDPHAGIGSNIAANSGSGGGSSTTKTDVHIDTINVTTAATDAPGIARDIGAALRTTSMAVQANTSPH